MLARRAARPHPMAWMVHFAAEVLDACSVGTDGHTVSTLEVTQVWYALSGFGE